MKTHFDAPPAFARPCHTLCIALLIALTGCAHAPLRQQSGELDITTATDFPANVIAPVALRTVAPEHPVWPLRVGVEGEAWLQCLVDQTGAVHDVTVVSASYVDFGDAAAYALKRWTFAPGTQDGRPIAMRVLIPFRFELTDGERGRSWR